MWTTLQLFFLPVQIPWFFSRSSKMNFTISETGLTKIRKAHKKSEGQIKVCKNQASSTLWLIVPGAWYLSQQAASVSIVNRRTHKILCMVKIWKLLFSFSSLTLGTPHDMPTLHSFTRKFLQNSAPQRPFAKSSIFMSRQRSSGPRLVPSAHTNYSLSLCFIV